MKQTRFFMRLAFLFCLGVTLTSSAATPIRKTSISAAKTKKTPAKPVKPKAKTKTTRQKAASLVKRLSPDVILSSGAILVSAKQAADNPSHTRLPQIDILRMLFFSHRDDKAFLNGSQRFHITGPNFAAAYTNVKRRFEGDEEADPVLKSKKTPPRIEYSNFKDIVLSNRPTGSRLDINLTEPYTQEIPYTFGAKIAFKRSTLGGFIRAGRNGRVTEILFDDHFTLIFFPPSIAFFMADIYVKLAAIVEEKGTIYGYVIGRPVNAPDRFMAVRYNLTTCAKTSIKTYSISPTVFKKKLRNIEDYSFAE